MRADGSTASSKPGEQIGRQSNAGEMFRSGAHGELAPPLLERAARRSGLPPALVGSVELEEQIDAVVVALGEMVCQ